MMKVNIHIFTGFFENYEAAKSYAEEHWEPEPENTSEEDYQDWEDNNPSWTMMDDLNLSYLSPDFIELRTGDSGFEYLRDIVISSSDREELFEKIDKNHNTIILIGEESLEGTEEPLGSTKILTYHGVYKCKG